MHYKFRPGKLPSQQDIQNLREYNYLLEKGLIIFGAGSGQAQVYCSELDRLGALLERKIVEVIN